MNNKKKELTFMSYINEVALIKLVQQYQELYDTRHPQYVNNQRRERIWAEIGKKINASESICKERWTRIRDNFRKALILRKIKSGDAASKIKPPKYIQELTFLIPYIQDEENKASNVATYKTALEVQPSQVLYINDDSPGDESQHSESPYSRTCTYSRNKSHRSTDTHISVESLLKEFLVKQKSEQSNKDQDPLIAFFVAMGRTVLKFNKKKQLDIKRKLFELVHSAELEMINDEDSTSTANTIDESPQMLFISPLIPQAPNTTMNQSSISSPNNTSFLDDSCPPSQFTNEESYLIPMLKSEVVDVSYDDDV